jgi:acetyl esterase/lipase
MKLRRLALVAAAFVLAASASGFAADPKIIPDVVYGHKDGMALTFDAIQPEKPNGAGILWLQSGGWYSPWTEPKRMAAASTPFLAEGFTMFIVRHGSAPRFAVPDAVSDVIRSVRYIREHAREWEVDPERLGVTGGSAGGHLTLMIATTGDDGDPDAKDEVLKGGSRIAAAVAFYPPTDLRGWTTDPPAEIKKHVQLKPSLTFDAALEPEVSPLLKVNPKVPPVLIIHGDQDTLVPIEHGQKMDEALEKEHTTHELLTLKGAGHGFAGDQAKEALDAQVAWFKKYLTK